jgi:hypothetical protein
MPAKSQSVSRTTRTMVETRSNEYTSTYQPNEHSHDFNRRRDANDGPRASGEAQPPILPPVLARSILSLIQ